MKDNVSLDRKLQLAFACAILALLIVGAISYRGMAASTERDRWVRHTHEVLESLQDLSLAMESIESSYSGFVLTGKESYIESYDADVVRVQLAEKAIRSLTVGQLQPAEPASRA